MQSNQPFTIYNASAGSGKTFTLVKAYLKILFSSNKPYLFKNILAITFTNKAVAEMKGRIIDTLKEFSGEEILKSDNAMFSSICNELDLKPEQLHNKAITLLESTKIISELFLVAKSTNTGLVSFWVSPITTGILVFIIPPFSKAINSKVLPKN